MLKDLPPLHGFSFADFRYPAKLQQLDAHFLLQLQQQQPELQQQLLTYRQQPNCLSAVDLSNFLIKLAVFLEHYLAEMFAIAKEIATNKTELTQTNPISDFKNKFILKKVKPKIKLLEVHELDFEKLNQQLEQLLQSQGWKKQPKEQFLALTTLKLLEEQQQNVEALELITAWSMAALTTKAGKKHVYNWISFALPERKDFSSLVKIESISSNPNAFKTPKEFTRDRAGFDLTDNRMNNSSAQDHANYCIYCHTQQNDYCSKGFYKTKKDKDEFKQDPLDVILNGCPLEEKISEMNFLRHDGYNLAALAVVMIDNPMCPATGHRICNDCMKSCIFQKQDPVNIPQVETNVLTNVLDLPWGVEIYDLLTKWNPLRAKQWLAKPYNGFKVMIVGAGPAGFTMAHHLSLEGCQVTLVEGLKIEPLPKELLEKPIKRYSDLTEKLSARVTWGFGGVAEYGITSRWDKNFLKLIYLSLMRRENFQVFDGVRFGGTVTVEDAWAMGFDHLCLAVGAGLPKALPIKNSLAPGMRQAADFLMSLQLTGTFKNNSFAAYQIRLPAIVVGGGLTGVDTATEVRAYYLFLVEKIYNIYQQLSLKLPDEEIFKDLNQANKQILTEYIAHGKAVVKLKQQQQQPDLQSLIDEWGGVKIVYRKAMTESPAYRINHEELDKALQEGIEYHQNLEPVAVEVDKFDQVEALVCKTVTDDKEVTYKAKSIFIATGARANVAYSFEHKNTFEKSNHQYMNFIDSGNGLLEKPAISHVKQQGFGIFTSYEFDGKLVSVIGDTNQNFSGSVVKAIASAYKGYPLIMQALEKRNNIAIKDTTKMQDFNKKMLQHFVVTITKINKINDNVLSITIKAPQAAANFSPGQFFRIQNYESSAPYLNDNKLLMAPIALYGIDANVATGEINFLVWQHGANRKILSHLKVGEKIVAMGPTGVRTKITDDGANILLVGNKLAIAYLRAVGPALKQAGNKVYAILEYYNKNDIFELEKLQQATTAVIWADVNNLKLMVENNFNGNAIDVLQKLQNNHSAIDLATIDRVTVNGDINLINKFNVLINDSRNKLMQTNKIFAAVNNPMQCMLKGVCAQCLIWQIDPVTKTRTKAVFACSWQDQPINIIDLNNLEQRQHQDTALARIYEKWFDVVVS